MLDFIRKKVDVLVCTTSLNRGSIFLQSQHDIINRADKFGLAPDIPSFAAGWASERAGPTAYLIIPGETLITRDAQKRLRALLDFSELGPGSKSP